MSSVARIPISGGYVSRRDPRVLLDGELQAMTGLYLEPGDSRLWKSKGRTRFGLVLANEPIKGVALCLFDNGSDKLVAYASTALYGATPGTTGTFASLVSGLDASGEHLAFCHMNDHWYLGNGIDQTRVLASDGTVKISGMQTPGQALTGTPGSGAGSTDYPTANTGGFTNPTLAYDANENTFASATLSAIGSLTHTFSGWGASAAANRKAEIRWWLSGLPLSDDSVDRSDIGTGGRTSMGCVIRVKIEKSEDGGTNYTTLLDQSYEEVPVGVQTLTSVLSANSNLIKIRCTATYVSGTSASTFQLREVRIKTGSTTSNFSTTTGVRYAYTEYDSTEDRESPPSPLSANVVLVTQNQVALVRPAQVNARATHWKIYRIADGASATITQLFYIATALIGDQTYTDDFSIAASDQGSITIPFVTVDGLPVPRDTQGPAAEFMFVHDASLVLLDRNNPRQVRYSETGRPESFPEPYIVSAFSLDEHDRLLCGVSLGPAALLFAESAVLLIDGPFPRAVDGQFNAGSATPIKGHPGCVGRMAMCPFSVEGEARAAWVSPFGVYQTNGSTCGRISLDLDWDAEVPRAFLSTAVLKWDARRLCLVFCFDSDGDGNNDREALIHVWATKASGQPTWNQPTPKAISSLATGLISAEYLRYSGHPSDGYVYLEDNGLIDEATGNPIACRAKTGEIDADRVDSAFLKALLLHTDWGEGATGTLTVEAIRRTSGTAQVQTKAIALSGQRGHEVFVGRAGEAFTVEFTHSAAARGAIVGVDGEFERQGRSGSAPRWQTVPAST